MKLVRTFSMIIALAGASTAFADTKPADKAPPAEKKAPPAKDAPKGEEISAAEAAQVEAFFEKFSGAIIANKDNCPKMAVALNKVIDENQDFIKKANDYKASGKKLPKATEDKINAKVKDMLPGVMKCQNDKDVSAAMARMEGGKKPAADKPADKPAATPPAKK